MEKHLDISKHRKSWLRRHNKLKTQELRLSIPKFSNLLRIWPSILRKGDCLNPFAAQTMRCPRPCSRTGLTSMHGASRVKMASFAPSLTKPFIALRIQKKNMPGWDGWRCRCSTQVTSLRAHLCRRSIRASRFCLVTSWFLRVQKPAALSSARGFNRIILLIKELKYASMASPLCLPGAIQAKRKSATPKAKRF